MKKKQRNLQIILISTGILLILITYFYYPYMKKVKFAKEQSVEKNLPEASDQDKDSAFENVEYRGFYNLNKPFIVLSDKAHIFSENPDIVHMTNMKVSIQMSGERTIVITSDRGKYNKVNYNCFFESNVKATDGETIILSENLDLIATEDFASIYNNVDLTSKSGSLKADKVDYYFEADQYKISMFNNNDKVKIKLIE